jgi:tellurite resistance protein TerC
MKRTADMSNEMFWWIGFGVFVLGMLALDLGVFHRKAHEISLREALIWTGVWVGVAMLFNAVLYFLQGKEAALTFLTGYVIEKSLSVDNVFVFYLIFSCTAVPRMYQHRVLFWGIIGALVMRAILIAVGITLINTFHWIIFIFGGFLIITGIKMGFMKDKEVHPENNPVLKVFCRIFPTTECYEGERFFVRRLGRLMVTPLFVVLVMVETTDLVFAVDSIPAILAITTDPFIVYTSNVFAILGLRALFFALAGVVRYFRFLHYGLSLILVFVGAKMVLSDLVHVPIGISLTVISVILMASIFASLLIGRGHVPAPECEVVCSDSREVSGSTYSGSEH